MTTPSSSTHPAVSLPSGYRLVAFESVGSTNDEAKRLARNGAAQGTVVWALRQEAGRGRRGRAWVSEDGNLYCSIILRPEKPEAAAQVSFVSALAVGDAVRSLLPDRSQVQYKWPNDVLIDERKVSGILLESEPSATGRLEWLVLGVGINVRHFPSDTEYPATSLSVAGQQGVRAGDVLEIFVAYLDYWLTVWRGDGFPAIRRAWLHHAKGVGKAATVRLADRTLQGVFRDLDGDGALLLEDATGTTVRITAGDVFFGLAGGEG